MDENGNLYYGAAEASFDASSPVVQQMIKAQQNQRKNSEEDGNDHLTSMHAKKIDVDDYVPRERRKKKNNEEKE